MPTITVLTSTSSSLFCRMKLLEAGGFCIENRCQGTETSEKISGSSSLHGVYKKLSIATRKSQRACYHCPTGLILATYRELYIELYTKIQKSSVPVLESLIKTSLEQTPVLDLTRELHISEDILDRCWTASTSRGQLICKVQVYSPDRMYAQSKISNFLLKYFCAI